MNKIAEQKRIFGLDAIRSLAILLVLIGHLDLKSPDKHSYFFYLLGYYGVELFFILSGFLIGQILIKLINYEFTISQIRSFWVKRWLRTLPLYYLVLIIRIIIYKPDFPYLHFFFLQNLNLVPDKQVFFGESWSLAVEEIFYFIIPVILYLIWKISKNLTATIVFTASLVIGSSLAFRVFQVLSNSKIDFELDIRLFSPLRLDSLTIGIVISFLKLKYNRIYKFLQQPAVPVLSLIITITLLLIGNILVYDLEGEKLICSTIGIIANSLLLALLLPYFEKIKEIKYTKLSSSFIFCINTTAKYSYCMYLIHMPIYDIFIRSRNIDLTWWMQMICSFAVLIAIAHISFYKFETPFLSLRNKLKS